LLHMCLLTGETGGDDHSQGIDSLTVEEIVRRTQRAKTAELGYYDWCVQHHPAT
jgi:hypothetical protein